MKVEIFIPGFFAALCRVVPTKVQYFDVDIFCLAKGDYCSW